MTDADRYFEEGIKAGLQDRHTDAIAAFEASIDAGLTGEELRSAHYFASGDYALLLAQDLTREDGSALTREQLLGDTRLQKTIEHLDAAAALDREIGDQLFGRVYLLEQDILFAFVLRNVPADEHAQASARRFGEERLSQFDYVDHVPYASAPFELGHLYVEAGNDARARQLWTLVASGDPVRFEDATDVMSLAVGNVKRMDQPESPKSSKCFIATAATGSPTSWEVQTLRLWRDTTLASTRWGREGIRVYERVSPPASRVIAQSAWLRGLVRTVFVRPAARFAATHNLSQPPGASRAMFRDR